MSSISLTLTQHAILAHALEHADSWIEFQGAGGSCV